MPVSSFSFRCQVVFNSFYSLSASFFLLTKRNVKYNILSYNLFTAFSHRKLKVVDNVHENTA